MSPITSIHSTFAYIRTFSESVNLCWFKRVRRGLILHFIEKSLMHFVISFTLLINEMSKVTYPFTVYLIIYRTHTYVHTCIHIHTYMHSYIHTYIHTYIRKHMHTHTYIHTCTHTYTYIHSLHTYRYILCV